MSFVKLATICDLKQWKTIPMNSLEPSGYPVWGANGIIGFYREYNHVNDTLMICCRGATCGRINVSRGKAYITGNAMCCDNLSPKFLLDFIRLFLIHYDFRKVITGAAQPQITQKGLQEVQVPNMPIEKQKEICGNLMSLEKKHISKDRANSKP
jgi:type I restriction enzyme S subunit